MTKTQEIDALVKFTNSIPKDSYLWPWLVSVQASVVADIRNDVVVGPSIEDSRKQCSQMLADAEAQADGIIREAKEKAEREQKTVREWRQAMRDGLLQVVERTRQAVQGY
jgi:cell division septum initiation protein DivIVA